MAGCQMDSSGLAVDAQMSVDAADGIDASVGDTADAAGDVACAVVAPPGRWALWPMPDSTAGAGAATAPSYDLDVPGVVGDRVTRMQWQRAVDDATYTWAEATDYCACLTLNGQTDWRLPTRIELVSLVDVTRQSPSIDPTAFPDTPSEWFWTSSPAADDPTAAWYVAFFDGDTHHQDVTTPYRVRCVHAGATTAPDPRLTVPGDGTATDNATGLTWQAASDPTLLTWSDAAAACAALPPPAGAPAWRLPKAKELETLIDETRFDPAIDETIFPGTGGDSFWASTPLSGQDGFAWFVSFYAGIAYNSPTAEPHRVRCVR
ncbi:MAG TPA: DUF1566 domain-containing protein [Polyangia bacterium]